MRVQCPISQLVYKIATDPENIGVAVGIALLSSILYLYYLYYDYIYILYIYSKKLYEMKSKVRTVEHIKLQIFLFQNPTCSLFYHIIQTLAGLWSRPIVQDQDRDQDRRSRDQGRDQDQCCQ